MKKHETSERVDQYLGNLIGSGEIKPIVAHLCYSLLWALKQANPKLIDPGMGSCGNGKLIVSFDNGVTHIAFDIFPDEFIEFFWLDRRTNETINDDNVNLFIPFGSIILDKLKEFEVKEVNSSSTIDERIQELERRSSSEGLPGTSLSRCLDQVSGFNWVLSIGKMSAAKKFFYGKTIEEVVCKAEEADSFDPKTLEFAIEQTFKERKKKK